MVKRLHSRVNFAKNFLIYLGRKGFNVFVPHDVKSIPTDFQPHIYTDDEVARYFQAVDTYVPDKGNKKNLIQLPVIFRILYCCGTRINETLGIRKKDVDLENGIIALYETKNNCARYIVLSDELANLLRQYADKVFYALDVIPHTVCGENRRKSSNSEQPVPHGERRRTRQNP